MDDQDAQHFSQYPMPPRRADEDELRDKLTASVKDEYLASLETYIDELGEFIRGIQQEEVRDSEREKKREKEKKPCLSKRR